MIKFENTETYGWDAAIRGMRNPMNSWDKSDTHYSGVYLTIGKNDLNLMKRLWKSGTDHRKYLRQIMVTVDITAPFYWWKEFDTYKVGTVANSCSTMHTIHKKEFTEEDFSCDQLGDAAMAYLRGTINYLNDCRSLFLDTHDKKWWWQMIQLLPSSYNQKRTVSLNYEVLANMYRSRKDHKLDEWRLGFVDFVNTLPYNELITGNFE